MVGDSGVREFQIFRIDPGTIRGMEFGRHLGKGIWAFADKALPAVYGVGYVVMVIRTLPEQEFGAFAIVQTMYLILSSSLFALTLQPLIKFLAEGKSDENFLMASLVLQISSFALVTVGILIGRHRIAELLDPSGGSNIEELMLYLIPMLALSYFRSLALVRLQIKYFVQQIFVVDAFYYIGMLLSYAIASVSGLLYNATNLFLINIVCLFVSSLVAFGTCKKKFDYRPKFRKEAMAQFWNYGRFNFAGSTTSLLFSQADSFVVSSFWGVQAAATYSAAKIFNKVFDVLNQVIQMFLVPFSAKQSVAVKKLELESVAAKTIAFSTILLFPLLVSMICIPTFLLHLLYGDKYLGGTGVLQFFGLYGLIIPWNSVIVSYMQGIGLIREGFYAGALLLAISFTLYFTLTPWLGISGTALSMVVAFFLFTEGLRRYLSREIKIGVRDVFSRSFDVVSYLERLNKSKL